MTLTSFKQYVWQWGMVLIAAFLLSSIKLDQYDFLSSKLILLVQAIAIIATGNFLFPQEHSVANRIEVTVWCFMLAIATLILALIFFADLHIIFYASKSAMAVFFLSYFIQSITRALIISFPDNRFIVWHFFSALIVLFALPLWIAPWAEEITNTRSELNSLLWISPLSYLSGMIDYDYLRSQWFYQHTPFGMLRYDYPNNTIASLILAGVSLALLWLQPVKKSK